MLKREPAESDALGRGAYGATEGLRLLNFSRSNAPVRHVSRNTVARWLRGYDFGTDGEGHSEPLWHPDYSNEDNLIEFSFRDLIELRFVKAFRDIGLALPTIRECYQRAAEEVHDERPFSTRKFRTDGKTIFLEITEGIQEAKLVDLRRRQNVFRTIVEPSLKDLEFDASAVARWFPLGIARKSIIIDPTRAFGRPIAASGVPTEVLSRAVTVEGSVAKVGRLYNVSTAEVKDAVAFEKRLAA
jgi:DNA-binding transcriptional MerR regulator